MLLLQQAELGPQLNFRQRIQCVQRSSPNPQNTTKCDVKYQLFCPPAFDKPRFLCHHDEWVRGGESVTVVEPVEA
jgi:hypothetical protein